MNTEIIVGVTVAFIIAGWYFIGKAFKGEEKEDRRWRWAFRAASVGVGCIAIGAILNKNEVALIGFMILALVIWTGFSRTD